MLTKIIGVLLLSICIGSYAYSETNGENSMIKLVFVLKITDEEKYIEYRNIIRPLMNELGIIVLKEYRISKIIHSKSKEENVNMLAMFGFPSTEVKNIFFSSDEYQEAKLLFLDSTTNFAKLIEE